MIFLIKTIVNKKLHGRYVFDLYVMETLNCHETCQLTVFGLKCNREMRQK